MSLVSRCCTCAAIAGLLLTACSHHVHGSAGSRGSGGYGTPSATGGPAAGSPIPVGPGPQPAYAVQKQPAPGSCHYRYKDKEPLPDANCTPGALNPKVTQPTLATTICRSGGYTSDIRPPTSITSREKKANAASYSYTSSLRDAEYDHLISLELGGDPNDARNLWVEPPSPGHRAGSGTGNDKDKVESVLHSAVCKKQVTLAAAQQAIASDWTTAEAVLGISHS